MKSLHVLVHPKTAQVAITHSSKLSVDGKHKNLYTELVEDFGFVFVKTIYGFDILGANGREVLKGLKSNTKFWVYDTEGLFEPDGPYTKEEAHEALAIKQKEFGHNLAWAIIDNKTKEEIWSH